jgi:hypothetical protein
LKRLAFRPPETLKTFKILKTAFNARVREGCFRRRFLMLKSKRGEKRYRRADGFATPCGQRAVAHKALGQRFALPTTPQAPHRSKRIFDGILRGELSVIVQARVKC